MQREEDQAMADPIETQSKVKLPGVSQEQNKVALLEMLKMIGYGVSATLGDWCEVVVHDLGDLDHSIVFISGDVTGRDVGGHMTDLGLAQIRSGQTEPAINYTSYTNDGKTLKCSSILIHDEEEKPVAAFCLNLNVTPVLLFGRFLRSLPTAEDLPEVRETFVEDVAQLVETMVAECAYEVGKPISLMNKHDRLHVVKCLDEKGVFQIRKSVPLVADRLQVSEKTVYSYLAELEETKEEGS
jgi:predicted transcriptional regulator YheO